MRELTEPFFSYIVTIQNQPSVIVLFDFGKPAHMDPIPIVIVFVSVTLTTILGILSIQVWNILKEIRNSIQKINTMLDDSDESIKKVNKMLDDAGKVSGSVSDGVVQMSGLMSGIRAGISVLSGLVHKKREEHE